MMEAIVKLTASIAEIKAEKLRSAESAGPPARPKPIKYLCGGRGADDFTEVRWRGVREIQISDEYLHKILREIEEGVGLIDCMCIFVCC